jgi:4-hydroxy-3-methylbut-2-enyl diphosphate reductase
MFYNKPMEILIAEHAGFCEGVERAFHIALKTTQSGQPVYMLGNLVHNKQVVERLISQGVKTVTSLSEVPASASGILLISAHGVPPEVFLQAKRLNLSVVDTTCPWVKKAQKIAKELADAGRFVIIVGDKGHPEVISLVGWSSNQGVVIERLEDLAKLNLTLGMRVGILAQTTQAEAHFKNMVKAIKQAVKDTKEYDTICGATSKRQNSAVGIARKVNLMLVIGDKMSANTKRLTELCTATGKETHQIETSTEFISDWLKGKNKLGITAGASTPEWVINEVLAKLKSL